MDSIAPVSVFPAPDASSNSADGSLNNCSGSRFTPLQFRSKLYHWTFQLAQVSVTILGAELLHHHHLLVDIAGEHLLEPAMTFAII